MERRRSDQRKSTRIRSWSMALLYNCCGWQIFRINLLSFGKSLHASRSIYRKKDTIQASKNVRRRLRFRRQDIMRASKNVRRILRFRREDTMRANKNVQGRPRFGQKNMLWGDMSVCRTLISSFFPDSRFSSKSWKCQKFVLCPEVLLFNCKEAFQTYMP